VYLSKLEGYKEAALWRRIFDFTEQTLGLPSGSIKATVLIENIYAAFEMDEILYALRHHSAGLNCGMWDYTASIVVNFRAHAKCVLPDRQRFVSMRSPFLQ
jgi:malate synthase